MSNDRFYNFVSIERVKLCRRDLHFLPNFDPLTHLWPQSFASIFIIVLYYNCISYVRQMYYISTDFRFCVYQHLCTLPLPYLKVYDILTKKVYVFWQTKISTFNQINTKKIAIKISNHKKIWVSITMNIKEINRV